MLRLFHLFGQSAALNALDDALRAAGLHPLLVPEAVKLTVIRLAKRGPRPLPAELEGEVALLAYCMLGHVTYAECNGDDAADRAEARLEAAMDAGTTPDAKLVLLALHAGLLAPEIAERIDTDAA